MIRTLLAAALAAAPAAAQDLPPDQAALKAHVKQLLAPYKYPRWIEFLDALPKTATGKLERYKLRQPPAA